MGCIETKPCKTCGKVEEIAKGEDECLQCRIKRFYAKANSHRHAYYIKNKERIAKYMKDYRQRKKETELSEGRKDVLPKEPVHKRKRWTVEFIKTEGGYTWRAWFRNPTTERLVKFVSAYVFNTIEGARNDYEKATR